MRLCIILYCGWLGWRIFSLSQSSLAIHSPEASTESYPRPTRFPQRWHRQQRPTADSPPPVYLFNCPHRFINDLYTRRPCIRGLAISARASSSSYVRSLMA
ncbi:hypothetical protein V8C34DRAFT_272854 [Trichoderma compactum]